MRRCQAKSHWRSVVLHVDRVVLQTHGLSEVIYHQRKMIKGIFEVFHRRHAAVTKARIIRSDDVIPIREQRDQIAKHVR
jgi:hypothetical protein